MSRFQLGSSELIMDVMIKSNWLLLYYFFGSSWWLYITILYLNSAIPCLSLPWPILLSLSSLISLLDSLSTKFHRMLWPILNNFVEVDLRRCYGAYNSLYLLNLRWWHGVGRLNISWWFYCLIVYNCYTLSACLYISCFLLDK